MASDAVPHLLARRLSWDDVTREAAELLSTYLRIDTSHPRGRTSEAARFLAERLAADGIDAELHPVADGKVNLLARLRSDKPIGKPLVLGNHMDVVPAEAGDWTFPPFAGVIADGWVYGRGALDMKGMGVMELLTMLLLRRTRADLSRDVILLCTCDEEIRSDLGTKWMVDRHLDSLRPALVLNEGGFGTRGFLGRDHVFEVAVDEKRSLPVRMVARGAPGHGSQPSDGAATRRLVKAAQIVLDHRPPERLCHPVAELVRRLGGDAARRGLAAGDATRPMLADTISLTLLSGGYATNVIPERAEMTFDCRLLPDTDPHAFVDDLRERIDDPAVSLEVTWPVSRPAQAPWATECFEAIERACAAYVPGSLVTPSLSIGGTDAHFFRDRGIPAYGLVPCMLDEDDVRRIHGVDERLSLENLRLGTQIMFDFTVRIAAVEA